MAQGVTKYPISQFLSCLIEETGHTRDGFVFALGYRNLERGRRRLDAWMDRAEGDGQIVKQIVERYPGAGDELQRALTETARMKTAEWETAFLQRCKAEAATFVPFVHPEGDVTVPNGITIFGMTGGHQHWTRIEIPSGIAALPMEEQLIRLPELMRAYRRKFRGFVPFFGKLRGFKLVRAVDYYQFDADAAFVGHVSKPFRHGVAGVSLPFAL